FYLDMGQKTNPIGNRLGIIRGWDSNWYGGKDYTDKLVEDEKIRNYLSVRIAKGGVSKIVIERTLKRITDQLKGVSDVMDNFANEIVQERAQHDQQELQIIRALKNMQIQIEKLDIYQLEKGNTDIEMALVFHEYHGEGAKLIAPVLTDILNET